MSVSIAIRGLGYWQGRDFFLRFSPTRMAISGTIRNQIDAAADRIKSVFTPAVPLADDHNVDSEIRPGDLKGRREKQPQQSDRDLVNLVMKRYKESASFRQPFLRQIYEGIAFESGNQWVEYSSASNALETVTPDESQRWFWVSDNQIQPLVLHNTARATQQKPDVWPAPLTQSQEDIRAAQTARAILAHVDRRIDKPSLIREVVHGAQVSSTCFLKVWWDADAMVDTAEGTDPQGNVVGASRERLGDVDAMVLLPIDMYPDPKARRFHDADWVIHAQILSLTEIQRRWPERGMSVAPSVSDGDYSSAEMRLESIASQNAYQSSNKQKNAALVLEMWERPSTVYPKGRFITVAGDRLMESLDWPYKEKGKYPFIPCCYHPNLRSIWGRNMVGPLIPLQRTLNRTLSHIAGRASTDKASLLISDASEVSPDAYDNVEYRKILYRGGTPPPTWQQAPPPHQYLNELMNFCIQQMQDIAGVHDIASTDKAPPQLSGTALELIYSADTTKLSVFVAQIESALVEFAEWVIALYQQYGTQYPRLVGLDDMANPADMSALQPPVAPMPAPQTPPQLPPGMVMPPAPPGMQGPPDAPPAGAPAPPTPAAPQQGPSGAVLLQMEALANGQCRVVCTPGSGMPKSPAAEEEQLQDIVKMMSQAFPGNPDVIEFYLAQTQVIRSNENTDKLLDGLRKFVAAEQAKQPDPMAIQQLKNEQAQAAAQIDIQAKGEMEAVTTHSVNERAMYEAMLQRQQSIIDHQNAMQIEFMKALIPSTNIQVKAGGQGTEGAEQLAHFPVTDDPGEIKAMNAPKPTATGGKKGSKTNE